MSGRLATFRLLAEIALRNLFAHRLKTFIIGGIILFGTLLVVVGTALLDSVERAMASSIVGSVAGHIQIYTTKSKDELAIWGNMGGSDPDLVAMDDFSKVKERLEKVPNVKTVVPQGIAGALVTSGNSIDRALEELRGIVRKVVAGNATPEEQRRMESLAAHVRQMATVLRDGMDSFRKAGQEDEEQLAARATLEKVLADPFWTAFRADPLSGLEALENELAPLASDADMFFLRYVGTDMASFAKSFDRIQVVDGSMVPPGKRGFMFAKFMYEEQLKLKNARRLDKIKEALDSSGRKIAGDVELSRFVKENMEQIREIELQLDPDRTQTLVERLQRMTGSKETTLAALLPIFFNTTDDNFAQRYDQFYKEVAPLLQLYKVKVGDTLTIKAFTRTGFVQSVNVKVYGTFQFKGLEKAALAGVLNLMDIISFRELYGYVTAEKVAEIEEIKKQAGAREVSRENAEAELFGDASAMVAEAVPGVIDDLKQFPGEARALRAQELAERVYSQDELEKGVALNAAVILKDPSRLRQTLADINAVSLSEGLGVKAVSWQQAAGLLGQMVTLLKLVLYVAVGIIFVVALVIINNAMMMATLERVNEIGTLRAIGAQKRFVLVMVLFETVLIGWLFGTGGALLGAGIIQVLKVVGIPATSDAWYFFFSGPRLHPSVGLTGLLLAFGIVVTVSALSAIYPAWLATRIQPVRAMQAEE